MMRGAATVCASAGGAGTALVATAASDATKARREGPQAQRDCAAATCLRVGRQSACRMTFPRSCCLPRERSRKARALTLVIEVRSRADANSPGRRRNLRANGTVINVQYALPLIPAGCAGAGARLAFIGS